MKLGKAIWCFVNGAGVVYHGHLYSIREVNEDNGTCTLISLPYENYVFNVPISKLTAEWEYDWGKADRRN